MFGVVFIESHSLGICVFDSNRLEINCGQILYFTYGDKDLLKDKLSQCAEVITNQPKHPMFSEINNKISEFKGELKTESLIHIIKELPFQNLNGIKNIDNYIQMMSEES